MTDPGAPLVDAPDRRARAGRADGPDHSAPAAPLGSGTVVAMAGIAVLALPALWRERRS